MPEQVGMLRLRQSCAALIHERESMQVENIPTVPAIKKAALVLRLLILWPAIGQQESNASSFSWQIFLRLSSLLFWLPFSPVFS